jgi:F0F1-type ATP synthase membrane subunit b/b'
MAQAKIENRLCPHCANSVALDMLKCPYCKASLIPAAEPQWPRYSEPAAEAPVPPRKSGIPLGSKVILLLGLLVFALGIYLVGSHQERRELGSLLDERQKSIQDKEQKIKSLEEQLAQVRDQLKGNTAQLQAIKAKLEERDKNLAAAQKRLTQANRENDRLAANRVAASRQTTSRAAAPAPAAPTNPRRVAAAGMYEITRPTTVFEGPDSSSRILSRIGGGTEITVVRAVGEWLEIRSKHGNPPGFIHSDDAKFIARARAN